MLYKQGFLISEQEVADTNPLFDLATVPRDLQATSPNSSSQLVAPGTHTHLRVSPDPLHQLLSKLAILELYLRNLTFLFILHSKKSRCQTPTTHTKISQVISVKHVQHSLRMDHKGSETCRSF
jgi:hypothetical protein